MDVGDESSAEDGDGGRRHGRKYTAGGGSRRNHRCVTRVLLGWRDWERIMTSGYVVLLCLIAAAVGTGATLSADTPIRQLAPGDTMPRLKGEFLTGREAVLPDGHAARWRCSGAGSATTLVFRSTWMMRFRELYPPGDHLTFFEVPMLGAGARLGRWFIDSGMRRGPSTPQHNVHENVITATAARATGRRGCVS